MTTAQKLQDDYIVRAMGLGGTIRAIAVYSASVGRSLSEAHGALPTAASALCRMSTAALLLGGTHKGREQVGIQIKGNGPIGELYAIADAQGNVRVAIDHPAVHLPPRPDGKFDVGAAVGVGTLTVTRSLGLKEPYQGIVPLTNGEIAQDLVHYFLASEQKPTAMGLGEIVDGEGVRTAGGFLIQAFPGADDDELAEVERRITELPPVSQLLADGLMPEGILQRILPDLVVLARQPVQFVCNCSQGRCESILLALGEDELVSIIEEQDNAELRCHFCNTTYSFSGLELSALLQAARAGVN